MTSICTDGAPAMVGRNEGFVGQLIKNKINAQTFHCIIHQECLSAKFLSFHDTMKTVTGIVNKIRGGHQSLSHRQFKEFLKECNADFNDLTMHNNVRWLSQGKCLHRFFSLRKEVLDFLENHLKNDSLAEPEES